MRRDKLIIVILLLLLIPLGTMAQKQKVTLNLTNVPVSQVFMSISRQTGLDFVYSNSQLGKMKEVTIKSNDEPVGDVLKRLFAGTFFGYKFENGTIVVTKQDKRNPQIAAENGFLVGVVTDVNGDPLPGTTIKFKDNNVGTAANANGHYRLDVRKVEHGTLTFSFLGMKEKEVVYKGQSHINVVMEEDSKTIEDVVVTGYGTYNRGQYVGAINRVKADDIKVQGESTIDQMLQGVVPGMSVVNTTGKVGGTPKIRIRGTSTLLGNQEPLWVVDNVIQSNPTAIPNDASPLSSNMDDMLETAGNAISWLNPADIETITVLKDASATAIYGSQASNGVIVITTKKARETPGLSVNYSGSITVTQKPTYGLYDMMNSQQYMQFQQDLYQDRDSYTQQILPIGYAGLLQQLQNKTITKEEFDRQFRVMENRNTNWFDQLFRTPISTQQNVSVSSGTQRLQSRFSVGLNSTPGEAKGNDMTQFTASTNNTYRANDRLVIDLSMNGSYRKTNNFFSGVSPYEYAMNTSRALPMYNEDGTLYYYPIIGTRSSSILNRDYYNYNIQNEIDNTGVSSVSNTFQAAISLKYDIVKHLQFQGDASLNIATNKVKSWATEYSNYITQIRGYDIGTVTPNSIEEQASPLPYGGMLNMQNQNTSTYSLRGAMIYNNVFNKKHSVTFNLGMQVTSNKVDGETNLRYGYLKYRGETFATIPEHSTLANATGQVSYTNINDMMRAGSSIVNTRANGLSEYFTAVYSYDNRYVVNLNGRMDASNRFGQDENKKFNPSFSMGAKWRIGEEPWMQWARNWYDLFDISFSYGWRGNAVTEVSPYLIAKDGGMHTYFKQYYLSIVSLPYPNLGWEKTRDWNFGLDFSFFDGRLSAGFNTYNKNSKVLASHEVGPEYGVASAFIDGTTMKNHGYEFIISATPIRTTDWTWSLSFNTGRDFNSVENNNLINTPTDYLSGTAIVKNKPYGTLYAFDFAGLDPKTGRPQFNNLDKTTVPVDFRDYLVEAGCTQPNVSGGINTSLRYKEFHLRAQFAMSLGAQAYLPNYFATSGAPRPEQNVPTYMFDRWRVSGDEVRTNIPAIPAGNPNDLYITLNYGSSSYYATSYQMYNNSTARIADTDFIRCRSLSLQYDMPKDLISRVGMRNGYITASFTNPFFIAFDSKWDGRDPETSSWPARRSFSLALNLTF